MNIGDQIKQFYRMNPLLSYLIIGDLILILAFGGRFLEAIFSAYLIYFGGIIFKYYVDRRRMLNVLIGGFIVGMITTIALLQAQGLSTVFFYLKTGLTAGSIALFVAAATYVPNMEVTLFFLGRVKLKWIAIALVALELLNAYRISPIYGAGNLAGALFAFLLIYFGRNRSYTRTPNFLKWFMRPRGPYYKKTKSRKNTNSQQTRSETDEEYRARKNREQAEIDRILEKIKQKGYDSLSASEKQKLFDKSNNG